MRTAPVTTRFSLWSGPRNLSTAVMYSFAQRRDTRVLDEPLYAHYLTVTGLRHPGREEILAHQESDIDKVITDVVLGPCDRPLLFMKQMTHHLVEVEHSFLSQTLNGLLIRQPDEVLRTLPAQIPEPTISDTALPQQVALYDELVGLGQDPPVIDARHLLENPRQVLSVLCETIGVGFDEAMLTWEEGGRPEDGVWAPHWYQKVHRSTGFEPHRLRTDPFPPHLEPLLADCRPYYEYLYARAYPKEDA